MTTHKRRARKPKVIKFSRGRGFGQVFNDAEGTDFQIEIELGDTEDARRLIKFLQQFVAWAEGKNAR